MEQIKSINEYKEMIRWNKSRFGAVNTNCTFLPWNMEHYIGENRLYAGRYEDGITFFVDEGRYYNLFYFWKPNAPFDDFRQDMPVLLEELNNKGTKDAYLNCLEPILADSGFIKIRNNLQVEATSKTEVAIQEYARYVSLLPQKELTMEYCTAQKTMQQVISLWEHYLDPTDIPQDHMTLAGTEKVLNVIDKNGNVVATNWWRTQGKTSECRHTVTHPAYQHTGLATVLVLAWIKDSLERKVSNCCTWISDENVKSLSLYGKLGFDFTGKTSRQYILK